MVISMRLRLVPHFAGNVVPDMELSSSIATVKSLTKNEQKGKPKFTKLV